MRRLNKLNQTTKKKSPSPKKTPSPNESLKKKTSSNLYLEDQLASTKWKLGGKKRRKRKTQKHKKKRKTRKIR